MNINDTKLKTFEDLEFHPHPATFEGFGTRAKMDFDNGYGVSVITGSAAYTTKEQPYEVAVMKDGDLCYTTDITDDVIGHCTSEKVTEIMKLVQELSNKVQKQ